MENWHRQRAQRVGDRNRKKSRGYFEKFTRSLFGNSGELETNKYTTNEEDWITVVSDGNNFVLFDFNHTGINDISVIINDDTVKVFSNHNKGTWMTRTLGRTEEINKIKIFLNDALIRSYDFSIIDKEKYIKKNWIKNK